MIFDCPEDWSLDNAHDERQRQVVINSSIESTLKNEITVTCVYAECSNAKALELGWLTAGCCLDEVIDWLVYEVNNETLTFDLPVIATFCTGHNTPVQVLESATIELVDGTTLELGVEELVAYGITLVQDPPSLNFFSEDPMMYNSTINLAINNTVVEESDSWFNTTLITVAFDAPPCSVEL